MVFAVEVGYATSSKTSFAQYRTIVQRGHNRQVLFTSDDDFQYYRENLILFKKEFGCKIYSYCLMANHVHLLVNPGDNPESLSLLMKL